MNKKRLTFNSFYFYLILIASILIVYVLLFVISVVSNMLLSLAGFNGVNLDFKWVGSNNYDVLIHDEVFRKAMVNTFWFALGATILQNLFAIVFAMVLNTKLKSKSLLRSLLLAPCILSPIVVTSIWQFIYMPDGLLDKLLRTDIIWLGDRKTALLCTVIAHVWVWIRYSSIIYMFNLQNTPNDMLEAAAIGGAGSWQKFRTIILPMLAPVTTISVILAFTQPLKVFDIIYAMTGGDLLSSTEMVGVPVVASMNRELYGYASAQAAILATVIVLFGQLLTGYLKRREGTIY